MSEPRTHRILVVTDKADPTPGLVAAMRQRAGSGDVQFRLIVLNPARAEVHLLHPERHDKASEAEEVLLRALPGLEAAAGGPVIGSVSVRNDPMDAIEETVFSEPIDEIMLAPLPAHHVATWLHQDLEHRLSHLGIPVTVVHPDAAS
ncbi:hypothetical protein [Nocardioides sp.]|jgi:hypothetical protein|uniref:hypothetical protein n=1 Tax=Nocardioides sp. TaxID=35761 RepID=UPI0031FEF86B|nr:hypothetical protein [Nocardioides sp.]